VDEVSRGAMDFTFSELLELLTGFQFAFLASFLFLNRRKEKYANRFLILFLVGKSITLLYRYTYKLLPPLPVEISFIYYWGYPFLFFNAPLFYLYVQSLTDSNYKFTRKDLVHWIPFMLLWLLIPAKYLFNYENTINYIEQKGFVLNLSEMIITGFLYYFQAISYTLMSIHLVKKYRKGLRDKFSSHENTNLGWAIYLLFGFLAVWVIFFSEFFLHSVTGLFTPVLGVIHITGVAALFTFANILAYRGLKFPEIPYQNIETKSSPANSFDIKSGYIKLQNLMIKEKPYLEPGLNIFTLARMIGISQRNLSDVINGAAKENFYDFINRHRIEEAKKLLISEKDKTILDIAIQSGFNSKSVFNSSFKKFTSVTPNQYKKQNNDSREFPD